jgi:hypothetical protein
MQKTAGSAPLATISFNAHANLLTHYSDFILFFFVLGVHIFGIIIGKYRIAWILSLMLNLMLAIYAII